MKKFQIMENCLFRWLCKIILFLHLLNTVFGISSAGSCRAKGYTGCCSTNATGTNCPGEPPTCFCDPSVCNKYNDCCSDLDQICSPELDSLKPVVVYPSITTFHTATLHWIVLSTANQIHINITYQVLLTEDDNSLTSLNSSSHSEYSFLVEIMKSSGDGNHAQYRTELFGLKHGTSYRAAVMVLTNTGIHGDAVETHFRTLEYNCETMAKSAELILNQSSVQIPYDDGWWLTVTNDCPSDWLQSINICKVSCDLPIHYTGQVQLKIRRSSSVLISWTPLSLPSGVSLTSYQVSYRPKHQVKKQSSFSPDNTERTISNLSSQQLYSFEVSAIIMERDGSMHTISLTSSSTRQDIFIPESSFLQLVTFIGVGAACGDWNVEFECLLKTLFHSSLLNLLNLKCSISSSSLEPLLKNKQLACQEVGEGEDKSSYVTYRAELFSSELCTVDSMIKVIDVWRSGGAVLRMQAVGSLNRSELKLESSKDCPVKIDLLSTPFCYLQQLSSTLQNTHTIKSVSLPIVLVCSAVEFILLLILYLSVSLLVAQLKAKRRRKRHSKKTQDSESDEQKISKSCHSHSTQHLPPHHHQQGGVKILL